jgi:diguanylate cyclase (GGDEF)-like protein
VKLQVVRLGDGLAVTVRDVSEQKQVEETLRGLALVDELTGVHNRRGFMALAEREWQRARREGRAAVLAYIDLDGFKSINDTHGHAEGDCALRMVAEVLRTTFRGVDVIGRLGGDEFAVLVVPGGPAGTSLADVTTVERRLRERIAHHLAAANAEARAAGRPYDVAMSIGTACLSGGGAADDAVPSLAALMVVADERLYEAKRARTA